jgi:hypothetical protein
MYPDKVPPSTSSLWLQLNDGTIVSNEATLAWGTTFASQHSYSLIGCASLSSGTYTIKLMASMKSSSSSSNTSLCIAAGANLSVFPSAVCYLLFV